MRAKIREKLSRFAAGRPGADDPGGGWGAYAVGTLEVEKHLAELLLDLRAHRLGLIAGEPDHFSGGAEGHHELHGAVEIVSDVDRDVAAVELDVGEARTEEYVAGRVGAGHRERPGTAGGLVGLLVSLEVVRNHE